MKLKSDIWIEHVNSVLNYNTNLNCTINYDVPAIAVGGLA